MEIKKTRQVRLDELLKLVWDEQIPEGKFYRQDKRDPPVEVGKGYMVEVAVVMRKDLFTIEESFEITEDTNLNLVIVDSECCVNSRHNTKISKVLKDMEDYGIDVKFIHIQNDDGKVGQLIWEDGKMLD